MLPFLWAEAGALPTVLQHMGRPPPLRLTAHVSVVSRLGNPTPVER